MAITQFIKYCDVSVNNWASKNDSIFVSFFEDKHFALWTVEFNLIKIDFVFSKKEQTFCPVGTLFCRIYLNKNDELYFHLPELIAYMDLSDYRCYYFSYIENKKRFQACFDVLSSFLNLHLKEIEKIAGDSVKCNMLSDAKHKELTKVFTIKEKDIPDDSAEKTVFYELIYSQYETFILLEHYTRFDGYIDFLKGDYSKSIKEYEKLDRKNKLTSYDKKLLTFIRNLDDDYCAITSECASFLEVADYRYGKKDFVLLLKTLLFLFSIFSIFFFAVIMISNKIMAKDTLFYSGLRGADSFIFAGLPAAFGSIAFKNKFNKLFNKKNAAKAEEYDNILYSSASKITAIIFFEIVLVLTLIFAVDMIGGNMKVYDDYMVYKSDAFLSDEYEEYQFDELLGIYHVDGRYNVYGDWIERESYIFSFSDGRKFDTDLILSSEKEIEEKLIPILKDYVDDIKYINDESQI